MARARRTCTRCPTIITTGPLCPACTRQADKARGTAHDRGYTSRGHKTFRREVLARDPICRITGCHRWATIADHHPHSRRELIDLGLNPDDPNYGRGLCKPHHDRETAQRQPGGWNNRTNSAYGWG